jgi:hypothetical protein
MPHPNATGDTRPGIGPVQPGIQRNMQGIAPKPAGWGSTDCKLGLQGPIKARAVLEQAQSRDIRRGSP